jgi:hypothetical protein
LVDVDRFYGIEYEEFPAQIAQVAMWLIDHQMNMQISTAFGDYVARIPLRKAATIVHGNALRIDWGNIIVSYPWEKGEARYDYILGNPPFLGHHMQTEEQKSDLHHVLHDVNAAGVMDYVTAWYVRAAAYLYKTKTKAAFVSTNSIVQGEQVGILWSYLISKFGIKIHFAHRTFKWSNEAKGNAAVYCVIIGFANYDIPEKRLYEYQDIKGEPQEIKVKNINPYLVDAKDILITNRSKPICNVPAMMYGSKPTDNGHFLLTEKEKIELEIKDSNSSKFIREFISAREYLNGEKRYCIWLVDADPKEVNLSPEILKRIELVKNFREDSKAASTRDYKFHTLFRQVTQPNSNYLLVPRTTSENRNYIPISFFSKDVIVSDTCQSIPNASLFHFGILTSTMHMAWVKTVCGRLESRFRYSKDIVYNNFPWPENPTEKQKQAVEQAAQQVLDARAQFPNSSLADLYDPLTMPPALVKAHQQLDKAVDQCYRSAPFTSEAKRMEFLFELYEKYTAGLLAGEKKKTKKTK